MSTARSLPTAPPAESLADGQRMDRDTFRGRYEAEPPGSRFELIGGVVSMPSPVGPEHARKTGPTMAWMLHYERFTAGVEALDNVSTAIGPGAEVQPDASLRIRAEAGGRTRSERALIVGAPELIVEVAHASRAIDLGPKRIEYERAGVIEYVVVAIDPDQVIWHAAGAGGFARVDPDADGLFRSAAFPGLWLDPSALLARDLGRLIAALDRGLATPEHAAFVARLAEAGGAG